MKDHQCNAITRRINSFVNSSNGHDDDDDDDNITGVNYSIISRDDVKSLILMSSNASSSHFSKTKHQNILGPFNFMVDDLDQCLLRKEDMSLKDLKTLSLQLKLLHLLLQKKSIADKKKEDEDLLLTWQLVRNAEQRARSLSSASSSASIQSSPSEQEMIIMRQLTETVRIVCIHNIITQYRNYYIMLTQSNDLMMIIYITI